MNGNNTYVFYRDGSSGVCVEAHPELAREIATIRPEGTSVSTSPSESAKRRPSTSTSSTSPGLSTIDAEEAAQREAIGTYKVVRTVSVPMHTINDVIAAHFATYPALLSLDIEGMDYAVLRSLDDDVSRSR